MINKSRQISTILKFRHNAVNINAKYKRSYSNVEAVDCKKAQRESLLQIICDKKDKHENGEDQLNSLRSLPQYELIKSKEVILREILNEREDKKEKTFDNLKVQYRRISNIFKFFKEGILNIWRVNRDLRKILFDKRHYIVDYSRGDEKEGKMILKRGDFNKIIDELSKRISLMKIEFDNGNRDVKDFSVLQNEILISRKQFIEIVRDHNDFIKLPLFGLFFLVFEELSLPILYLFPRILPTTCVLPGILEKRYNEKNVKAFGKLMKLKNFENEAECNQFLQDIAMDRIKANEFERQGEILKNICNALDCRGTTVSSLRQRQKILFIDDYLILSNNSGTALHYHELVYWWRLRNGPLIEIPNLECLRKEQEKWLIKRFCG